MRYLLVLLLFFSISGIPAHAQNIGTPNGLSIESMPRFPEAGEDVTLSLDVYSLANQNVSITWYLDGIIEPTFQNLRTITTTAGDIGSVTQVRAVITAGDTPLEVRHQIVPTQVDLIVEADTTVPVRYQGRPLPSIGSTVRVIAIPTITSDSAANTYGYTWRLNNQVIGGGTRLGQNSISFTMPLDRESVVAVDVSDATGKTIAGESVVVPAVDPIVMFYPNNPLRGQSAIAINDSYTLVGQEIDIRAEPFFLDTNILTRNPFIEWQINSQTITNPSTDPLAITLQNAGGSGAFAIAFELRNRQQLLQGVEKSFTLRF